MTNIEAQDKFLLQSLMTFLKAQHSLYLETMSKDDPKIADTQARYEVGNIALAAVAHYICRLEPSPETKLPDGWQEGMDIIHRIICNTGDEWLRSQGYKPEEF